MNRLLVQIQYVFTSLHVSSFFHHVCDTSANDRRCITTDDTTLMSVENTTTNYNVCSVDSVWIQAFPKSETSALTVFMTRSAKKFMVEPSAIVGPAIFCSLILFLSGVLCSAAGIGGGGVYVAVLMLAGSLSPHDAVPLSKAIVFFGSLSSLFVNMRRIMQSNQASVIDFDVCRLVVPCALAGTYLGVLLNWHTADYGIVVVLSVMLTLTAVAVARTAWNQHQEEGKISEEVSVPDVEDHPALGRAAEQLLTEQSAVLKSTGFSKYQLHTSDVPVVVTLMSIVVLNGIMRFHMNACREEQGGGHLHGACAHPVLNVFSGRMGLWMQNAHTAKVLQMVAMTLPTWSCAGLALRYSSCCVSTGRWSIQRILLYQDVALATGVLAGLVGVGGGLVLSPRTDGTMMLLPTSP